MTDSIVILTGAGISAESGLQTFRGEDALWEGQPVAEVATPEAFVRNPGAVQNFYNLRRQQLAEVKPNPAHLAIARWQAACPQVRLITQNVDDLHERGGSHQVWHMHGELKRALCRHCGESSEWLQAIDSNSLCPRCRQAGHLRPDIVWFGEMPKLMDEIESALCNCDLFIAVGTSGLVYPAAGFAQLARTYGAKLVEINLQPTQLSQVFDYRIFGPASQCVPAFIGCFRAANGSLVQRLTTTTQTCG